MSRTSPNSSWQRRVFGSSPIAVGRPVFRQRQLSTVRCAMAAPYCRPGDSWAADVSGLHRAVPGLGGTVPGPGRVVPEPDGTVPGLHGVGWTVPGRTDGCQRPARCVPCALAAIGAPPAIRHSFNVKCFVVLRNH